MPRKPLVPINEVLKALLECPECIDSCGSICGPTSQVWINVALKLNNRVKPNYLYQIVKENRYESYTKLTNCKNITSQRVTIETHSDISEDCSNDTTSQDEEGYETQDEKIKPKRTFEVLISNNQWESLKPVKTQYKRKERNSLRALHVLPPYKWESALIELLWDQHKLPCPYSFIKGRVSQEPTLREQFILINAKCNECGAEGEGKIMSEPIPGEAVKMLWRAEDTRQVAHKHKRYLYRESRREIGRHIASSSASVFRTELANNLMNDGDIEAPHLYQEHVLRKAKQEVKDLTPDVVHGPDPIIALGIMKHEQPHCGSIHDIGQDKFFVHYYTQTQMKIYRTCARNRYTVLSIDATGSLVRKILRINGPSSHLFLYEGVMLTSKHQIPVLQMISEKQDANTILYWLNEWERAGAPCPNEVVIDDSKALKSALCRSFGRSCDVNEYKTKCFLALNDKEVVIPPCYIRIDLAHFLKAAIDWTVWKEKSIGRLKQFYLHCLGLLITSTTLKDFEQTLVHILIVAFSEEEGEQDNSNPMEVSLKHLTEKIKGVSSSVTAITMNEYDDASYEGIATSGCNDKNDDNNRNGPIETWIEEIRKEVEEKVENGGNRPNPYFSVDVGENFTRLAKDFTLWSSVMKDIFQSPHHHASTANVESEFNNIKHRILKGENRPLLVHKMVDKHLKYIYGLCKIVATSTEPVPTARKIERTHVKEDEEQNLEETQITVTNLEHDTADVDNPSNRPLVEHVDGEEITPNDLNFFENWRNQAVHQTKPKKPQYTKPCLELETAMHGKQLKVPSKQLLQNGNLLNFALAEKNKHILVRNTCPFDVLVSAVSSSYIDNENYRKYVDSSDNKLLKTSKSLATNGATTMTYKLRAQSIMDDFKPQAKLPTNLANRTRKNLECLTYDIFGNVSSMAMTTLKDSPSLVVNSTCPQCKVELEKAIVTVQVNANIIMEEGLNSLHKAINSSLCVDDNSNSSIPTSATLTSKIGCSCPVRPNAKIQAFPHVFVDLDFMGSKLPTLLTGDQPFNRQHALEEVPRVLTVGDHNYYLSAVIAHQPGHFLCYNLRRTTNTWDLHDDLKPKVLRNVDPQKTKVWPQLLMYVEP